MQAPANNNVLMHLKHHLKMKTKKSYSINRIENEFLNIRKDNNGTGAAISNKIGKPDPCIDFF